MPIPFFERSSSELSGMIERKVRELKNVLSVRRVRVDLTGKKPVVVVVVWLDQKSDYEETHRTATRIEHVVKEILPNSRVFIRTEPAGSDRDHIWKLVKEVAETVPGSRGAHNIHIHKVNGKLGIDFHLEVSANMTVRQASKVSEQLEKRLKEADPSIAEVLIHEESVEDLVDSERSGAGTEIRWYIDHVRKRFPEIKEISKPEIRRAGDKLYATMRCRFNPDISIKEADEIMKRFEASLKAAIPELAMIEVHKEPA
ncbi:MAG TPA: cation transporter dimerization domain-containing protein [Conexivisphaerales archaeon]|nr:cation transporter dimerization domain-containing protein [Conexivisphaerales archaeon]